MADIVKSSKELEADHAKLVAEAETLQSKSRTEAGLTAEEDARLEECLSGAENLENEIQKVRQDERLAASKERMAAPTRPAPRLPAEYRRNDNTVSFGEGLALWLNSFGPNADRSASAAYRARTAGFELGCNGVKIPVRYDGLNFKNRTVLSKGGSGTGSNWVYQTYSAKVVEYLTYFSPILGLLSSETTGDGNQRTYFKVDDTAMESAYITASSGTETNPTVADTNLATGSVVISTFDITSGFQKVSFQELRDSGVNIEDKVAKANSNSHARKLEREVITASGNGSTGVQGLESVATAMTAVAAWDQDAVLDLVNSIPAQYRASAIFLSNDATKQSVRKGCRDDVGRTLFDKSLDQGQEFDTFDGRKWVSSEFVTDDTVLALVPEMYQLRMVEGQLFQQFVERFWPHAGWAGMMSFGGAWLGPTNCVYKVAKS